MRLDLWTIDWVAISAVATALLAGLVFWQIMLQRIELQRREQLERSQRRHVRRSARRLLAQISSTISPAMRFREGLPQGVAPDKSTPSPDLSPLARDLDDLVQIAVATGLSPPESTRLGLVAEVLELHGRSRPAYLPTRYDDAYWTITLEAVHQALESAADSINTAARHDSLGGMPRWRRWRLQRRIKRSAR